MSFLMTVIIAVLSAFVTASLSMQRFKKERHWERKVVAYSQVRKSLMTCIDYTKTYLDYQHEFVTTATENHLRDLQKDRSSALKKAYSTVADEYFFICPAFRSAFLAYMNEPSYPEWMSGEEMAEADDEKLGQLLTRLDEAAERDLTAHSSNFSKIFHSMLLIFDGWLSPVAKRLFKIANTDRQSDATSEQQAPDQRQ